MPYRIEPDEPIRDAIVRIVGEELDDAIAAIDDQQLDEHEAVHEVRRAGKEIRAVFRLVRDGIPDDVYHRENRWYRDVARQLTELRDAHAHLESFDRLTEPRRVDRSRFEVIRDTLEDRRDELEDALGLSLRLQVARDELEAGRERLADLPLDDVDDDALAAGVRRTYRRAQARMTDAYDSGTAHAFHQWRKRVKYHRYHVELLTARWHGANADRAGTLHELTDALGEEHDLAELRATLLSEPERFPDGDPLDAFLALIGRERTRLQREAEPLGTALFEEEPDQAAHGLSNAATT